MIPKNTHFLVVDDSKTMLSAVVNILKDCGYTKISEASSVEMAMQMMIDFGEESELVEFIVSDYNMGGKSGLAFLKYVRDTEKGKDIPFLLMTSEATPKLVVKFVTHKVSQFIVKPIVTKDFIERLELSWEKHH